MRIRWSSDLETGVRAIDLQHEELINMLNELDAAHCGGCDPSVLGDVLQRLGAYAVFHFGTEESLMAALPPGDQHAADHLRQHGGFIEQLAQMRVLSSQDGPRAMEAVIDFLNGWLYEHILKEDRKLAALLRARSQ